MKLLEIPTVESQPEIIELKGKITKAEEAMAMIGVEIEKNEKRLEKIQALIPEVQAKVILGEAKESELNKLIKEQLEVADAIAELKIRMDGLNNPTTKGIINNKLNNLFSRFGKQRIDAIDKEVQNRFPKVQNLFEQLKAEMLELREFQIELYSSDHFNCPANLIKGIAHDRIKDELPYILAYLKIYTKLFDYDEVQPYVFRPPLYSDPKL